MVGASREMYVFLARSRGPNRRRARHATTATRRRTRSNEGTVRLCRRRFDFSFVMSALVPPQERSRRITDVEDRLRRVRSLAHRDSPCDVATFERRTSCEHLTCVLLREKVSECARALDKCTIDQLKALMEDQGARKADVKGTIVRLMCAQMRRGFTRGVTRSCDLGHAVGRWLAVMGERFEECFVHVSTAEVGGCEPKEFTESELTEWRRRYPRANCGGVDGYYETAVATHVKAYLLLNSNADDVDLMVRKFLNEFDKTIEPKSRTLWTNHPVVNARALWPKIEQWKRWPAHEQKERLGTLEADLWRTLIVPTREEMLAPRPLVPAREGRGDATASTPGDARERTPPPTATAAVATTTAARGEMFGADLARISPVPAGKLTSAIAADKAAKAKTPAKNAPGTTPEERTFYTRLAKADPMHEMISSQDNPSYPPGDLVKPQKVIPMKTFQQCFFLSATDLHFLQREGEFELQAVCLLANDDVKERMQWPLDVYLTANDHTLSVVKRSTVKSVTKSTRDPAVRIPASRLRSGSNHFRMFHRDRRGAFMIALRIVRKRSLDEVAACIPRASSETVALKHALKCLGLSKTDDDIIMEDIAVVSLRCPISGHVCEQPARLSGCVGLHTFDAQSFLRLNTVSRKWSCPECGKKGGPSDLRIDSFLKRCVDIMRERGLHKATRVEMDKDGRWRPREEVGAQALDATQSIWYTPEIAGTKITWKLDTANSSPASTVTKVGVADADSPNVQSIKSEPASAAADAADDDSELDEEEELKRAIREAAGFSAPNEPAPVKKRAPVPDVIVISDSDDDGPPRRVAAATTKRQKPSSALFRNLPHGRPS